MFVIVMIFHILTDGDALFSPCHFDFNTLRDDIDTQPCRETETELSGCGLVAIVF